MNQINCSNYHPKYLSEYDFFDGDHFITFNLIDIALEKNEITLGVTNEGKLSRVTYELRRENKRLYFEYGPDYRKIALDDFEEIEN